LERKYWYLIIFLISLVAGIIHGIIINPSINLFLSWIFLGLWVLFTLAFFTKLHIYRQLHSPHNTSFFIIGPMTIGILYSLWGYFTELLQWNLFGEFSLYLSPWTLFLAFPYLSYGLFSLYSCFQRYDLVYLGQKPVSARGFGFFGTILMLVLGIGSLLIFFITNSIPDFPLVFIHLSPDLLLLLTSSLSFFLLIRYGIFGRRPSISSITTTVATRTREITPPTSRISPSTSSPSSSRSRSSTSRSRHRSSKSTPIRSSSTRRAKEKPRPSPSSLVKKLTPKAGTLTMEDFKCIFCFQLPTSTDTGRGIVVCPNCRHPAHADEFKEWTATSNLCSRCDAPLPANFRRNPEIIPVKTYLKLMKLLSKKIK